MENNSSFKKQVAKKMVASASSSFDEGKMARVDDSGMLDELPMASAENFQKY